MDEPACEFDGPWNQGANQFLDDLDRYEKEKEMPFIAPIERLWLEEGKAKGLLQGIQLGLKLKFGQPGLDLLPRVQAVTDAAALETFLDSIETAPDLDALRGLLPPQA